MDSAALLALAVIVGVPAVYLAARLCLSLVVICKLLGTRERARRVLSAWRWAGGVACAAGGAATVLLLRGNLDNLLVQGGRVAGLFEGINQLQSFMMAVVPFLCARA